MEKAQYTTTPEAEKTALVLSGGGAKGAYQVGVMKALLEGQCASTNFRPLENKIYTGTSAGSYNAIYMASHSAQRPMIEVLLDLEKVWTQRIANRNRWQGNGIFRIRGDITSLLPQIITRGPVYGFSDFLSDLAYVSGVQIEQVSRDVISGQKGFLNLIEAIHISSFFDMRPLYHLLRTTLSFEGLRRSCARVGVVATNFSTGLPHIFNKDDLLSRTDWRPIAGSLAIPGIFPAIRIGGIDYIDGGATMNTPIAPALAEGAKNLHVIYLNPKISRVPSTQNPPTLETWYRLTLLQMKASIYNNPLMIRHFNADYQNFRYQGHNRKWALHKAFRENTRVYKANPDISNQQDVEIHFYAPPSDLGGTRGLLNFDRQRIERLIEWGYRDACSHNCQDAGCILADKDCLDPTKTV